MLAGPGAPHNQCKTSSRPKADRRNSPVFTIKDPANAICGIVGQWLMPAVVACIPRTLIHTARASEAEVVVPPLSNSAPLKAFRGRFVASRKSVGGARFMEDYNG
jgi:hypothetical protein